MGGPKLCLLGILLISIFRTPDVRAVTRCDAPAAYRHERAVITCYYETDVGFTKKDFSVYKRDVHDKYIDVLSCSWRTTPPDCKVSDGYIFDGNVTETMILVIPSATEEQEGQYTCQTIPSDPEDLVSCNFTLKRLEVTANMNTEDTPTANNDNGEADGITGLVVGLVAIIAVAVITTIIIVIIKRRATLRFDRKRKDQKTDTNEYPQSKSGSHHSVCDDSDGDQQASMETSVASDVEIKATDPLLVGVDHTTETEKRTVHVSQQENTLYKVQVESNTQPKVDHKKELFLACEKGDVEKLKRVFRAEYLHSRNSDGETPLHVASRYGHANLVEDLLFRGADIHSEDNGKCTPLHTASFTGAFSVVTLLLQKGAHFEKKTKDGSTPLHLACRAETKHASIHSPSIHVVSDSSVEYTSVSADGTHVTTPSGSDTVSTTDQKPAGKGITRAEEINDDESTDRKGKEIRNISTNQHEAVVKHLLSVKCNVLARDGKKRTPLHVASTSGNAAIIKMLVGAKAKVEARDRVGRTPLHLASQTDKVYVVKQLLKAGAHIDATEDNGHTPLQLARQAGKEPVVTFLLDHQLRTKTQQDSDQTPFPATCSTGNTAEVENI